MHFGQEQKRLDEAEQMSKDWKLWGPYVSERAWGTVREDYSRDGSAWDYFPFEQSHLKAYRWNEDGIAGICDRRQNLCFALAFWNGKDPILKERLFGLSGPIGNHGEDVKEYYYYLDNTPTHSYMKYLYKYPQEAFPYQQIYDENSRRDKSMPEYELLGTGVFADDRYFDIFIEYAKAAPEDICIKVTAFNRGTDASELHLLPTLWFRNTWSWFLNKEKPRLAAGSSVGGASVIAGEIGDSFYELICSGEPPLYFCENETNYEKLYDGRNVSVFAKDGINDFVTNGSAGSVNPDRAGTKAAAHYKFLVPGGESISINLRLRNSSSTSDPAATDVASDNERVINSRKCEADEFYNSVIPSDLSEDAKNVMRQSFAGLLWSKQFYNYSVRDWLLGDPAFPSPPQERLTGRNSDWKHLYNDAVISMPDKWEYPWYASWDLAFHCVAFAAIDPGFAKRQLILLLREWFLHPNGQIPAYEWAFSDVNPPVHAWAALRIYRIEAKRTGSADKGFLERAFHKLLLNFTWWVNRKDDEGNNVFEGGFLGLDNIGVFDRSKPLPSGGHLEQSDGTSWMAMFSLNMMAIALELARFDDVYEDVASKFFEHFVYISDAMNNVGEASTELWNERDGFYYDVLHVDGEQYPIKLRSLVGLIPLLAVETVEADWMDNLPGFRKRTEWFLENRPDLTNNISCLQRSGRENRRLMSLVTESRLRKVLRVMLSENEFLSVFGIRSLSRTYKSEPFIFSIGDESYSVKYEPGESKSGLFGGNSNWRGPIWFPVNFLLIEALQRFDYFYGDELKVEFPTGSERMLTLWEVSLELEKRLSNIFLKDDDNVRPVFGSYDKMQSDRNWSQYLLFYEYFHGESGRGLGASHQTGWTGLIGKILQQLGEYAAQPDLNLTINTSVDELLNSAGPSEK